MGVASDWLSCRVSVASKASRTAATSSRQAFPAGSREDESAASKVSMDATPSKTPRRGDSASCMLAASVSRSASASEIRSPRCCAEVKASSRPASSRVATAASKRSRNSGSKARSSRSSRRRASATSRPRRPRSRACPRRSSKSTKDSLSSSSSRNAIAQRPAANACSRASPTEARAASEAAAARSSNRVRASLSMSRITTWPPLHGRPRNALRNATSCVTP
mmetsp:Transcript_80665/g.231660  ORF Transcript_80665/g.231660 Transcript_80665/m.231660 type:complete len:222 (+) Transcript_80665:1674-2339(+)